MVVLTALPLQSIISGFRGSIDFYLYKGLPVARSWPRKPIGKRAPAVQPYINQFTYAMHLSRQLSSNIRQAYVTMASPTSLRWQDFLIRCYINGSLV